MKTMKKVMLTIMMVMISTLAIANVKPTVKVKSVEAKTVAVVAYGYGEAKTDITLRSGNGHVFYRETLKAGENFAKRLDMSEMPKGEYTIEVENSDSFTAIPVIVDSASAVVKTEDEVTIVKPRLSVIGDKLNVAFADPFTKEVWVSIYDTNSNRLVYEKVSAENMKRFDLSKLAKGQYTVLMSTEGKKFVQSLSLDK